MIKTRIASAAAILTFGLAGLGGTVVAIAAPATADAETTTTSVDGTSMAGTAGPAVEDARQVSDEIADATRGPEVVPVPSPGSSATADHVPFPNDSAPHSTHDGQGHKGSNEMPEAHKAL